MAKLKVKGGSKKKAKKGFTAKAKAKQYKGKKIKLKVRKK